jgi:hypothetical protein
MNNSHLSHKIFFNIITENKLNELLKRADPLTNVLQNHLNSLLMPFRCEVKLNKVNKYSNDIKIKNISYCDIIINYYDKNNYIGHFTLHLKRDDKSFTGNKKIDGRIHFKNINSTCYSIRCSKRSIKNKNNSVVLSIVSGKFIPNRLNFCSDKTIFVFNEYFNFNTDWSLNKYITSYPNKIHKCLNSILINFKKYNSTKIRTTIKKISKY